MGDWQLNFQTEMAALSPFYVSRCTDGETIQTELTITLFEIVSSE